MNGPSAHSGPHWRRVMAALANRDARTAYAQIVLGDDVLADAKAQRRNRAIGILLEDGLLDRTEGNDWMLGLDLELTYSGQSSAAGKRSGAAVSGRV